ncbi:MAG: PHP domain-containing protein [Alphaproteobacteria bacterium]
MIDLHIHTNASADAQHTPDEIFSMSRDLGLRCVAFADHNTINAIAQGLVLAQETGIEFITGVELNTQLQGRDVHLLGYGFDPNDEHLRDWFAEINQRFWNVAADRVERFVSLGLNINMEQVRRHAKGRLPTGSSFLDALAEDDSNRQHPLVQLYLTGEKAQNPYVNFYFDTMCNGGPADVDEAALPVLTSIQRFLALGAVPVVAHPRDLAEDDLRTMVEAGLMGVEAICSYHDEATTTHWRKMAAKYGLLITAGSDFHGRLFKADVGLGGIVGNEYELVEKLRAAIDSLP